MKAILRKKKDKAPIATNTTIVSGSGSSNAARFLHNKYLYGAVILIIAVVAISAVVLFIRQNNATEEAAQNDGGNPTQEIAASDAAGALQKVKSENANQQQSSSPGDAGNGSQSDGANTTVTYDGLPPPETMDYESSLETASNLSQTGASVEVVMAYYNRALALGGADNYAINLNIALFLIGTSQKQQAVPYIDKAIILLPTAGLDQETLPEQQAYLEELKVKAQS